MVIQAPCPAHTAPFKTHLPGVARSVGHLERQHLPHHHAKGKHAAHVYRKGLGGGQAESSLCICLFICLACHNIQRRATVPHCHTTRTPSL